MFKNQMKFINKYYVLSTIYQSIINFLSMDNLKYLKSKCFFIFILFIPQSDYIALLISASLFPAATAFSIKESEMSELDPNFIRSSVNGIPSF